MTLANDAAQVRALVSLRWRMIRSTTHQLILAVGTLSVLLVLAILVGSAAEVTPIELRDQALIAYPTFLLVVALISVLSPFLAGGATELYPAAHMVAFPVTARARFIVSLLLMPLNLAWTSQIVVLALLVSVGSMDAPWLPQLTLVTVTYVIAATVFGQSLAWVGAGIRQTRRGRISTNVLAVIVAVSVGVLAWLGLIVELADQSPLVEVLGSGLAPMGVRPLATATAFVAAALVAFVLGTWAVSWTIRRRSEISGLREGVTFRRREQPTSVAAALSRTNRAAVWRSSPLRRGFLLLVAIPVVTTALFTLEWHQLVLLPGLIAAGAALLFGVNAFSLFGPGALWLAAQPTATFDLLRAQARVTLEFIGGATAVAALSALLLARETPDTADLMVLLCATVAATAWVVTASLAYSVKSPHQADLRGSRDTPAPPGTMTGYSLRMAFAVSTIGLAMTAASLADSAALAVTATLAVLAFSGIRTIRVARAWSRPEVRSRVMTTVSAG